MICIIALIVFGLLGIFSVKYRIIAIEAADCVFRRLTLRKCESGLDRRLKNQLTGKLSKKSPVIAKFLYKNFEIISWIFLILLITSLVFITIGLVNFVKYGNCNGPDNPNAFCIYDPFGTNSDYSGQDNSQTTIFQAPVEKHDPTIGPENASVSVIQFGCTSCPYTKKMEPNLKEVIQEMKGKSVRFIFKSFPIQAHPDAYDSSLALECAYLQNNYFDMRANLLNDQGLTKDEYYYSELANKIGLDVQEFNECMRSSTAQAWLAEDIASGKNAQVAGTPTFFINGKSFVGVQNSKTLIKEINKELK